MTTHINLNQDDPTVTIALTLGTIVGERCLDAGSHEEPPEFEPITLLDAIVDRASERLVEKVLRDDYTSIRMRITETRDEMIREAIAPSIAAAMDAPIQRTNEYGERRGEPTTMRQVVIDAVHNEARAQLRTGNNGNYNKTILQQLLDQTVPKVLAKELGDEVAAAKATLRAAMQKSASQALADALASTLSDGR